MKIIACNLTYRPDFSDDFQYKAPFWEERPCDAYGIPNSLTALSGESTPFSVNPEYIRFNKEHSGLTYQILNANGLQMLRGNLKGGETEINISPYSEAYTSYSGKSLIQA